MNLKFQVFFYGGCFLKLIKRPHFICPPSCCRSSQPGSTLAPSLVGAAREEEKPTNHHRRSVRTAAVYTRKTTDHGRYTLGDRRSSLHVGASAAVAFLRVGQLYVADTAVVAPLERGRAAVLLLLSADWAAAATNLLQLISLCGLWRPPFHTGVLGGRRRQTNTVTRCCRRVAQRADSRAAGRRGGGSNR